MRRWRRQPPGWYRWVCLAMAAGMALVICCGVQEHRRVAALDIFSQEALAKIAAGLRFNCAIEGMTILCFLYGFFILTWNRKGDRDRGLVLLVENLFITVLVLFWVCVPLWVPLNLADKARPLWWFLLAVTAVAAGSGWVKYFKKKQQEEHSYE